MTGGPSRAVLRPGDWVSFEGGDRQVLAFAGTSVRLRAQDGSEQVVLASYLMAAPDFAVVGGIPVPGVEPFGLLDGLPEEVLAAARDWERHVVEVETGLAPDAEPGAEPRPGYDPQARTLARRTQAKAAELGMTSRTVERMRARYARQGLWGLVDQRAVRTWEATGRADARLVAAARQVIEAETHASTGTRGRLIRRGEQGGGGRLRAWRSAAAGTDHLVQADRHAGRRAAHVRVGGHATAGREPPGAAVHPDVRREAG